MIKKKLTTESLGRDGEDCPGRLPAREKNMKRRLRENSGMVRKKWWQGLTKGLFRDPFSLGLVGGGEAFVQAMHCPLCCNREKQRDVIRYFGSQRHSLKSNAATVVVLLLGKAFFW